MSEQGKKPWESKTLWTNLILAIVALLPVDGLQDWFLQNQGFMPMLFLGVNSVLRLISKDPIVIK